MRTVKVTRETKETTITLQLTLDKGYGGKIETGLYFFDHMLDSLARFWDVEMNIQASGDIEVDPHHLIEDVGIVLGTGINKLVKDKKYINRFGDKMLPMDDALVLVAIDIGGRSYLNYELEMKRLMINSIATEDFIEFFRAITMHGKMNCHIKQMAGENTHHIIEAAFKALGFSLKKALQLKDDEKIFSTKGVLEV